MRDPSLRSGFRLQAPASLTPAKRLDINNGHQEKSWWPFPFEMRDPSLRSGFRLQAPASLTPAKRLNINNGHQEKSWWPFPFEMRDPSLRSGFRLLAPASLTPANRLNINRGRLHIASGLFLFADNFSTLATLVARDIIPAAAPSRKGVECFPQPISGCLLPGWSILSPEFSSFAKRSARPAAGTSSSSWAVSSSPFHSLYSRPSISAAPSLSSRWSRLTCRRAGSGRILSDARCSPQLPALLSGSSSACRPPCSD